VVQRLPVRIELDEKSWRNTAAHRPIGFIIEVNTTDRGGEMLASQVRGSRFTRMPAKSLEPVNQLINDIIRPTPDNSG
jgi:membrane fusion protein (multidrug efflux system)